LLVVTAPGLPAHALPAAARGSGRGGRGGSPGAAPAHRHHGIKRIFAATRLSRLRTLIRQ